MQIKLELAKRDRKEIVYSIPCECGSIYYGAMSRPLQIRLKEHMKNVKDGKTQNPSLAEHVWDKKHKVKWDDADIVFTEKNWYKRKITEAAFITCDSRSISQISKDMPHLWRKNVKTYISKIIKYFVYLVW